MEKLNAILQKHISTDESTTDKLVGAAFIIVNKDGTRPSTLTPPLLTFLPPRNHLPRLRRANLPVSALCPFHNQHHCLGSLHVQNHHHRRRHVAR